METDEPEWSWLLSTYNLQMGTYGYDLDWFAAGLRLGATGVVKELAAYIDWNVTAAVQELAEARVEFSWKPWAIDEPFVNRERLVNEVVDVCHFLGNILTAMGVDDAEFEAFYRAKQDKNRLRAASKNYSAKKGTLGEGSDI